MVKERLKASGGDKLLVVGLDGATFDLIRPLVEEQKLPTFARLLHTGAAGVLRSTIPALTPPAWVSSVTGVNPGKHAIFDFLIDQKSQRARPASSLDWRAESLWHTLNRAGRRVGVLNFPVTFPPFPISGFMVSGMLTPGDSDDYVHPPEALSWLKKELGSYRVGVDEGNLIFHRRAAFLRDLEEITDLHTEAALRLARQYQVDVLYVIFDGADRLQHYYWHEWSGRTGATRDGVSAIERHYQHLDRVLQRLMTEFDADRTAVYSDHGFGELKVTVHIDRWLVSEGYARLAHPATDGTPEEERSLAERAAYRLGVGPALKRVVPRSIKRMLARSETSSAPKYDWSNTRAYFASQASQSIRINLKGREPEGIVEPGAAYQELCRTLIADVAGLRDPVSGLKVFDSIHDRNEIFSGPWLEEADDLILVARPGHYLIGGDHPDLFGLPGSRNFRWTGCHRREGLFILSGPGIAPGGIDLAADITDIAPTLLYWLGLEIDRHLDGKVITAAFEAEFMVNHPLNLTQREHPPTAPPAGERRRDQDDVMRRLREMGYLE